MANASGIRCCFTSEADSVAGEAPATMGESEDEGKVVVEVEGDSEGIGSNNTTGGKVEAEGDEGGEGREGGGGDKGSSEGNEVGGGPAGTAGHSCSE